MRCSRELCIFLLEFTLRLMKLMKVIRSVIAPNGVPHLQIKSVTLHSTSGRKKERMGGSIVHESMDCKKKNASVAVPPAILRVLVV